jgi:hypothetical protein
MNTGDVSNRVSPLNELTILSNNPIEAYLLQRVSVNHSQSNMRVNQRSTKGHPYLELDLYLKNYNFEQRIKMMEGMRKKLAVERQ